jgi:hypothetical protein
MKMTHFYEPALGIFLLYYLLVFYFGVIVVSCSSIEQLLSFLMCLVKGGSSNAI